MAAQLYTLQVKNTFIHIDADDDTFDCFSDEEESPKRQVTEPAPYTVPLLEIPRSKFIGEAKCVADSIEEFTTSSDHDLKDTEPFQPEAEPDLRLDDMVRQVTEEVCYNTWSGNQPELGMAHYCIGPLLGQAVPQQYAVMPVVQSIATGTYLDHDEHLENGFIPQSPATNKKQRETEKERQRRKRESLIDIAARKQKQQQKQAKRASQQQRRQAPSAANSAMSYMGVHGKPSTPQLAKYCHHCGSACEQDAKFCKFCGTAVLFIVA